MRMFFLCMIGIVLFGSYEIVGFAGAQISKQQLINMGYDANDLYETKDGHVGSETLSKMRWSSSVVDPNASAADLKNKQIELQNKFDEQSKKEGGVRVQVNEYTVDSQLAYTGNDKVPVITQKYFYDNSVELKYILDSSKFSHKLTKDDTVNFPQDFLLELPRTFLTPNKHKRLDQTTVLGTHNCFTNMAEGFLYYQQGQSSKDQYNLGGARMLRPAWHNPSGSPIDAPNNEPILCHSGDSDCKSVSLATRGFRKHEIVKNHNKMLKELLDSHPDQILLIGLNNFLSPADTDKEIEKIPGLADLILTPADLDNPVNKSRWGGDWPTIDWMIRHNKRMLILNDKGDGSKYSVRYQKYVRMNQYGTSDLNVAFKPRGDNFDQLNGTVPHALIELSWFQDISLDPGMMGALQAGVDAFEKVKNSINNSMAMKITKAALNKIGVTVSNFTDSIDLSRFKSGIDQVLDNLSFVKKITSIFDPIFNAFQNKRQDLNNAIDAIKTYQPKKQDNSINTLLKLIAGARKSHIIPAGRLPNIMLLDFATVTGDGIPVVNLLNILEEQQLGLGYGKLGGFALDGTKVVIPEGVVG